MTDWIYFPKSHKPTDFSNDIIKCFRDKEEAINSQNNTLRSNEVLKIIAPGLKDIGFRVETGKKRKQKIRIPVLLGLNGQIEKSFEADGYNQEKMYVIEIEAGRAVTNYQFLKDIFQASVMQDVDYLAIAVRKDYRGNKDFESVLKFLDTLYSSEKFFLPLKGLLLIGY